jgi:hypothetical protein
MTNDPLTEDRELDLWREQWSNVAGPSSDFQRQVQERIKLQDRRFLLANLLTAAAFAGMLIFAVYLKHQASWLGKGWATGVCFGVGVSRNPSMDSAENLACRDTIGSQLCRTLAWKSPGSSPVAPNLHLRVNWVADFLLPAGRG